MTQDRPQSIEIHILRSRDEMEAFRLLNEEWITRHFRLEEKDREILNDPEAAILQKGGQVFLIYADHAVAGCVALIPMGNGVYELSKMAVRPSLRGLGLGRRLLEHAIEQARAMGATSLFLGSSKKLPGAIHLYEAAGFRHVPPEQIPPMPYSRADVFMEMPLSREADPMRQVRPAERQPLQNR